MRSWTFVLLFLIIFINQAAAAVVPSLATISNTITTQGTTYIQVAPTVTNGATGITWTKEFGPDDMTVDPNTGTMTWIIPSTLPSEAFHVGVKATNTAGNSYTTWVLKVGSGKFVYVNGTTGSDTTGTGTVLLPYQTVSKGNGSAASGDAIIVQSGTYTSTSNMMVCTNGQGTCPPNGSGNPTTALQRVSSTAYALNSYITWSTNSTTWKCTTAGTTAATAPSISGITIGGTVTDGTVVWTQVSFPQVYTTIMSEQPGGAILDGQDIYPQPINMHGSYISRYTGDALGPTVNYIAIKGFMLAHGHSDTTNGTSNGSVVFITHCDHIKLIDNGAYDQEVNDSGAILNFNKSGYVLAEGNYAYGNGRECITEYLSDNVVTRRNVCRLDRANYADPFGAIVNYGNAYAVSSNNIVLDIDQWGHYGYQYVAGDFNDSIGGLRGNSWPANSVQVFSHNEILLNTYGTLTSTVTQDEVGGTGSDPSIMDNSITWDVKAIPGYSSVGDDAPMGTVTASGNTELDHMTIGELSSPLNLVYTSYFNGWADTQSTTNSIIYGVSDYNLPNQGPLFYGWENVDHNNIFNTGTINFNSSTVTNTIAADPTASTGAAANCLKYITRIEPGCALQTAGIAVSQTASGSVSLGTTTSVGATVVTMRGKSGTMWGDANYDTDNGYPMWPFPHEDLIKSKMQSYSFADSEATNTWVSGPSGTGYIPAGVHVSGTVSGNRGFASSTANQLNGLPVTLTSYIWEYLGNQMPTSIYGITTVNAACGSANLQYFSTLTSGSAGLCSPGTVSTFVLNTSSTGWTWGCSSTSGTSTTATACSATLDATPPVITSFTLPSTSATTSAAISTLTATDAGGSGVASYCVSTTNNNSSCTWTSTAPTTTTLGGNGYQTVYAWAKDVAGNISNGVEASTKVTNTTVNAGYTTAGTSNDGAGDVPYMLATQVTLPAGTLQSISLNVASVGGSIYLGIYHDVPVNGSVAAHPGAWIATSTAAVSATTAGWVTGNVTPTVLTAGTYWLAFTPNNASMAPSTGAGVMEFMSFTYSATLPTTFTYTSANSEAYGLSMYATLTTTLSTDTTPPVTTFVLPSSSATTSIPITTFSATDTGGSGVVGYCTTTTSSSSGCTGQWLATSPTTVTGVSGSNTFYGWAIDAANNISSPITQTTTVSLTPVNASCSTAAGQTTSTTPTTNLCGDGSLPTVTGPVSNLYSWTCLGISGGNNASCTSIYQAVVTTPGSCGTANGQSFTTLTSGNSNLCSVGTLANFAGTGPWSWNCNSTNGGSNASCGASLTQSLGIILYGTSTGIITGVIK